MKPLLLLFISLLFSSLAWGQNTTDSVRLYYFYTIGNQIHLSDFELGSEEKLKDKDGNGLGFNFVIREGKKINLALDFGYSRTVYKGKVEDNVNVSFTPQSGSGYEVLSSSTNITYDFNTTFSNPYLGLNIQLGAMRIGGGRMFQSASGEITLKAEEIEIAKASYHGRTQLYGLLGFDADFDGLYLGLYGRMFEAPELKIDSCNAEAVGTLVCKRILSATNNRNNQSRSFGEYLITLGLLF